MRSQEEIDRQIKAGEKFIEEHPYSMFGTDNKRKFRVFKKIIEKAQRRETVENLYNFADDAYEDSDDHSHACATIEWLFDEGDPIYSEDE